MKKIRIQIIFVFFILYYGDGLVGQQINTPTVNQQKTAIPLLEMVRNIFRNLSMVDNERFETGDMVSIRHDNLINIITPVFVVLAIIVIIGFVLYCCGCAKKISLWRQKWFRFE